MPSRRGSDDQLEDPNAPRRASIQMTQNGAKQCSKCKNYHVPDEVFCRKCGKKREGREEEEKRKKKCFSCEKVKCCSFSDVFAALKDSVAELNLYFRQPRYACGQLFVGSVVTSLAA